MTGLTDSKLWEKRNYCYSDMQAPILTNGINVVSLFNHSGLALGFSGIDFLLFLVRLGVSDFVFFGGLTTRSRVSHSGVLLYGGGYVRAWLLGCLWRWPGLCP